MSQDHRVHVSTQHLRKLQAESGGLTFLPRQAVSSVLNGRHGSRLRGRGLNFEEMRNYLPGDDIRSIDWKTTAKVGKPYVKVMTEEKDRPALLVVDQRVSMFYGTILNMKSVTAAEAAAIAAFRIQSQGDRVGGLIFNDDKFDTIAPSRSHHGLNAFISHLSQYNSALHADLPASGIQSLNRMLSQAAKSTSHNHLVIIFSDFDGAGEETEKLLGGIAEHNDLILMLVSDPSARNPALRRSLNVSDGQMQAELDIRDKKVSETIQSISSARLDAIHDWQTRINLSVLPLSAGEKTLPQIRTLMGNLAPRRRVR